MNQTKTDLLTPKQVESEYGISEGTQAVWRCTQRYAIPYIKLGRLVRYNRADIERWLKTRTVNSDETEIRELVKKLEAARGALLEGCGMHQIRQRPACEAGRGDSAEQVVRQVQLNQSTTPPPLPHLDAVRAAVKAAIVEAALLGAVDATRVHTAIKLLSLEDA